MIVRLDFRANAADCPPPTKFDVRLETEASAAAALYEWAADLCSAKPPFALDVTNTSSEAARQQFFLKQVDVGVSSLPPQAGEVPKSAPPFAVAPIDLTALVVVYNIVDPVTGHQITDVKMTPRLVARLVSDTDVLGFFNDPEFKALNPGHTFPAVAADPGVRGERNADTWVVTNWLNSNHSARSFLDGADQFGIPVNDAWKGVKYPTECSRPGTRTACTSATGEEDIALRIFHSTKPADGVSTSPADVGFFSILDLPTAVRFNLPIAGLTNGVGSPVVAPTTDSILAGYEAMTTVERLSRTRPGTEQSSGVAVGQGRPRARPQVTDAAKVKNIQRLLTYAVGAGPKDAPRRLHPAPGAAGRPDAEHRVVLRVRMRRCHRSAGPRRRPRPRSDGRGPDGHTVPLGSADVVVLSRAAVGADHESRRHAEHTGIVEDASAYGQGRSGHAPFLRDAFAAVGVGGHRAIRDPGHPLAGSAGLRICPLGHCAPAHEVSAAVDPWVAQTVGRIPEGQEVNVRAEEKTQFDRVTIERHPEISVVERECEGRAATHAFERHFGGGTRRGALALGITVVAFLAFGILFSGLTHAAQPGGSATAIQRGADECEHADRRRDR